MPEKTPSKQSYTVPCPSGFRDRVLELAARRGVNAADLARSVVLTVPANVIRRTEDPGDPAPEDREEVVLKSGPSAGRPWRRKPRLQVRLQPGLDGVFIRKALALALMLEGRQRIMRVEDPAEPVVPPSLMEEKRQREETIRQQKEEIERLGAVISVMAFEPLPDGVQNRSDALHVLGFPPNARPDRRMLRARFRTLATIHHPDSPYGNHRRMSQLNTAMDILRRSLV